MSSTPHVQAEIQSQPDCWRRAAELAPAMAASLPRAGERVAVIGCGTSWFMAQAYAARREQRGLGETDAFAASEFPAGRRYDRLVAITRSGTTSEVLDVLDAVGKQIPNVVLTADAATPAADLADQVIVLDFADEKSVVQTRFATTALALLRCHLGEDLDTARAQTETLLATPFADTPFASASSGGTAPGTTPVGSTLTGFRQFVFLGRGWTVGLAHEAALKMREASLSWAEAYPAMDYRHGPISLADPNGVVWFIGGSAPAGLIDEVQATGAHVVANPLDPMADLVHAQRLAIAAGLAKGLDPDQPRNLNRSVVLEAGRR